MTTITQWHHQHRTPNFPLCVAAAAALPSWLGICHSFHLLGGRRRRSRRVIWSHNLLEIYPSEINSISSPPSGRARQLGPCNLHSRGDPAESMVGGANSRPIKFSTTRSQIFNQAADLSPKPHSGAQGRLFSLLPLLPLRGMAANQCWFASFARCHATSGRHPLQLSAKQHNNDAAAATRQCTKCCNGGIHC